MLSEGRLQPTTIPIFRHSNFIGVPGHQGLGMRLVVVKDRLLNAFLLRCILHSAKQIMVDFGV